MDRQMDMSHALTATIAGNMMEIAGSKISVKRTVQNLLCLIRGPEETEKE